MHSILLGQAAADPIIDEALTSSDWIRAALILVGALTAAVVASRLSRRLISRGIGQGFAAIIASRFIGYAAFLVGVFYALTSLGVRVGPLLGALGLGGLVLALALQKLVENFIAAVILQTRRPFTIGDTVRLGEHDGVVLDVDARTTVLRGLDGTTIRIPNGNVVSEPIVNLTREPKRRSSLTVGVAYETNLEAAAEALHDALSRVRRVERDPAPLVTLNGFASSSIDFSVYYWHASDVPSELAARHDVVMAIHHGLAAAGITIAFPQMVVWSGQPGESGPYEHAPGEVFTPDQSDQPTEAAPRRRTTQWLRPPRRTKQPGDQPGGS